MPQGLSSSIIEDVRDYSKYLKSRRWQKIRRRVLGRDGGKCRSCGGRATEVHHGNYDPATMQGDRIDRLYSLCRDCHEAVSLDIFGLKRPFKEVRQTTLALDAPAAPKPKRHKQRQRRGPRKQKLSIDAIRALSQQYAEGKMR